MFELSILRKYLIPWKKPLSVTLIASMSIGVIALVVWLIILFISVTEGIEKNWLKKLTSLHAPIRITPTPRYYSSYYYLVDTISSHSRYTPRSLQEKIESDPIDPHDPHFDESIPDYWPKPERHADGTLKDPVKMASHILLELKNKYSDLAFQDFELGGAMLRLQLIRPSPTGGLNRSFSTQAAYLTSFSVANPHLKELIMTPAQTDINHLFFLSQITHDSQEKETPLEFQKKIKELLSQCSIKTIKLSKKPLTILPSLLPENSDIPAVAVFNEKRITHFLLGSEKKKGVLKKLKHHLIWDQKKLSCQTPIFLERDILFNAEVVKESIEKAQRLSDICLRVSGNLAGISLKGEIPWNEVEIVESCWSSPLISSKGHGILLSKQFIDSGVLLGDRGWLVYPGITAGSLQEQRLPVFVSGFYDPGVLATGNKCILASTPLIHMINTTSQVEHFDKTVFTGFSVWIEEIKKSKNIAEQIKNHFKGAGIDQYWKISTYHDYDFAKDLFQQFQSDRYLFTLIGLMILLVACSNIISLLVILVNDKKKEIGILQALGASRKSIALIFGSAGVFLGTVGSLLGTVAAFVTVKNLSSLVHFLSFLQGHEIFNIAFFGASLPHHFSFQSLLFVLITTPILSLIAGVIPAYRACRLTPSQILRSE